MTWSEKDIFYNYNQENFREKIIFLNKTKVEDNKVNFMSIYTFKIRLNI